METNMLTCPDCPEIHLVMIEHYEEYDDTILRQDQVFQCPLCRRVFVRTVWYKQTEIEWLPDEED